MISERYRFLFIHVPKTAGNSIQNILRQYSEDRITITDPRQNGVDMFEVRNGRSEQLAKHSHLRQYRAVFGDRLDGFFKFATIRNPFDKLVSYYFSPHRGQVEWNADQFELVCRSVRPFQFFAAADDGALQGAHCHGLDSVLRFEHLDDDFAEACDRIGISRTRLPVRNRSSRPDYRECYSRKLRELVEEIHAFEMHLGAYRF